MTISATTQAMRRGIWTGEGSLAAGAVRIADGLRLAAAPSYAAMALATAAFGESPKDMLCMAMHHMSVLGGMVGSMVWMYLLMSLFHSVPWLKLVAAAPTPPAGPEPAESRHTCHSPRGDRRS